MAVCLSEYVFQDGNKRAGAAAMLVFLEANGASCRVSVEDLAASMIEIQQRAEKGEDTAGLIGWLTAKLRCRKQRRRHLPTI